MSLFFSFFFLTHLYKQYHNTWFQIMSSYPPPPAPLPHSSLHPFCAPVNVCISSICVRVCMRMCVCVQVWVWGVRNTVSWLYDYSLWGFTAYIFVPLAQSGVFTLAGEIQPYRNDCYCYYHLHRIPWTNNFFFLKVCHGSNDRCCYYYCIASKTN